MIEVISNYGPNPAPPRYVYLGPTGRILESQAKSRSGSASPPVADVRRKLCATSGYTGRLPNPSSGNGQIHLTEFSSRKNIYRTRPLSKSVRILPIWK